jgi:hypothetical protein
VTRPEFFVPHRRRRISVADLLVLGAALAACTNDSTGPATPQFRIDSGAVAIAAPGQQIRYVIQLLTTGGQPMPAEPITASVVRGTGQLNTPAVQLTDTNGRLRISWQLGLEADTQAIQMAMEAGPRSIITVPTAALHAVFAAGTIGSGCAFDVSGTLLCWNSSMALQQVRAAPLAGAPRFQPTTLSYGTQGLPTACAIALDSKLWCWGNNLSGRLGRGTTEDHSDIPAPVAGVNSFRQVSAGGSTVCAVTVDSAGFCWGYGRQGQLGNGDTLASAVPQPVAGGLRFAQLATGSFPFTCGITGLGDVYCWGRSGYSPGSFNTLPDSTYTSPVLVQSGYGFVELAAEKDVICGRTALGAVLCWGDNWAGQAGDPNAPEFLPTPNPVAGGHRFQTIFSAAEDADGGFYALETTGLLYGWVGSADATCYDHHKAKPDPVAPALRFLQVSGGGLGFCGVTGDSTVYCGESMCYGSPAAILPPAP